MSFAWRRLVRGAVALSFAAGCSASGSGAVPPPPPGGDGGADRHTASLSFDPTAAPCPNGQDLCLTPAQAIDLGVTLSGPDETVTFALEGDYADASLGSAGVTTAGGHAAVTLHAPAAAATFTVRASAAGAAEARLAVAVSGSGFATIHLVPTYAGKRPVPVVLAQAYVRTSCTARASLPLDANGPWQAGDLANVPADSHVAVQARVEEYAVGCADVASLVPGATTDVSVAVYDLPLALDHTDLESTFTFVPDAIGASGWSSMLDGAITRTSAAFLSPATASDATALLDAMRAVVPPSSQAAFDAARVQGAWDQLADAWIAQRAPAPRQRASTWLAGGKQAALGALAAHLGPGQRAGYATVTLESFAGFDAASAGLSLQNAGQFAWTAEADDSVHLSGAVHVAPTALVARAADAQAAGAVPGATGVATALAATVDCAGLAADLVGAGDSYPSCDAACTAALCKAALAASWSSAASASAAAGDDVAVQIAASASAAVAADPAHTYTVTAAPAGFGGTWVGQVSHGSAPAFPMQGNAQAQSTQIVK
jgi:hypothetical protein